MELPRSLINCVIEGLVNQGESNNGDFIHYLIIYAIIPTGLSRVNVARTCGGQNGTPVCSGVRQPRQAASETCRMVSFVFGSEPRPELLAEHEEPVSATVFSEG